MHQIFIDGQNGTTGLQIVERLKSREDIALIELNEPERKRPAQRLRQ
jgi:N-acetyl-gamma-glutamyl-phosphate reductase